MKYINKLLITMMFSFGSSAHAGFIPPDLLDTELNDQSTYAALGVTLGARSTLGGNMQGFAPITIGVDTVVGGNVSAGTVVTSGAGSSVGGYIQAGTTASTGVGGSVGGSVFSGTTAGTGANSTVGGDIEAGTTYTAGAGAIVSGVIYDQLSLVPGYVAPTVINQKDQLDAVQATLNQLGVTEGATNLDITFGVVDETLTAGVYDSVNYLTIRAGKTLTLDGQGVDGDFLFNIHNYLDFAAGSKVELINFTDNSKVIWNVIGDAVGSSGYMQAAADVSIRGFIFAKGYVNTGDRTTLYGVGNSCGGAVSANNYVLFGADNIIGAMGCDTAVTGTPNLIVNFISNFEAGLDSLLEVTVIDSGYLNIWVDWDQSGQFDAGEQLVFDRAMTAGTDTFLATAPFNVVQGTTLVRARYTSTPGVPATGGAVGGEVEDYQVPVLNPGYSLVNNNPYFLTFEDKWPETGDYDFNDVVIQLESSLIVTSDSQVKQLTLEGELKAMGASYHNGFAIQLDGIINSDIDQATIVFDINGEASSVALLEEGTTNTVLKISEDLWAHVTPEASCWYYKTQPGCNSSSTFTFSVEITFTDGIPTSTFPSVPFNPFIFATPDTFHGAIFSGNPGRGLEIHLKNKPPTSLANLSYFGQSNDVSDPSSSLYYQTANGLPWGIAINIGSSENWNHPYEWVNILTAYPQVEDYATSNGVVNTAWFESINAVSARIYNY
jgi:LruC domain-containing protein